MSTSAAKPHHLATLFQQLSQAAEPEWLNSGRQLMLSGDLAGALAVFSEAASRFPASSDAHVGQAGLYMQMGDVERAESSLRGWLTSHPGDAPATFLLAQLLRDQGRLQAVGSLVRELFDGHSQDIDTRLRAVEMLNDYGRQADAAMLCESVIDHGNNDAQVHAYAGMLAIQLGQFERARERYTYALAHDPQAVDWNTPLALAGLQRYSDPQHPDLLQFRTWLQRADLSEHTRRIILFALGKAHDDLGDYATAAGYLREANQLAHAHSNWSRKQWKRSVEARLAARPYSVSLTPPSDWTPVFIVGVPRSGTTLLADRVARHPQVRNRGELGWMQFWEQRIDATNTDLAPVMQAAARHCAAQWRQDDAPARCYIDKQPLNLLRIDLIMALWPNARIIHCQRDARDTALSLWTQSFHDTAHDYAYDFADIAAVVHGCNRLAAHWSKRYPASFRSITYEELVNAPAATLGAITDWLGIGDSQESAPTKSTDSISTASVWQARQPVYTSSIGRWRHYTPYLPELLSVPQG